MTTKLTKAQAWHEIAEAFFGEGDGAATSCGLCLAVSMLYTAGRIDSATFRPMRAEIGSLFSPGADGYLFEVEKTTRSGIRYMENDSSREARDCRGMIALWFALDAELWDAAAIEEEGVNEWYVDVPAILAALGIDNE